MFSQHQFIELIHDVMNLDKSTRIKRFQCLMKFNGL